MISIILENDATPRLSHMGLQVAKGFISLIQRECECQKTRQILVESGKHWNILSSPLPQPLD